MKASKSVVMWGLVGIAVLFSAGAYFVYRTSLKVEKKTGWVTPTWQWQPAFENKHRADKCRDCIGEPAGLGFFDNLLPPGLWALSRGPWPDWVYVDEDEIIFPQAKVRVPYSNPKFAKKHSNGQSDESFHVTPVDIPLLIPEGRGVAIIRIEVGYEWMEYQITIFDRGGKKLFHRGGCPMYPQLSPNGEYILIAYPDVSEDAADIAFWILRLDGSTHRVVWVEDFIDRLKAGFEEMDPMSIQAFFAPDSRHLVAFVNGQNPNAVPMTFDGEPLGYIPAEPEDFNRPLEDDFWWAITECTVSEPIPEPEPDSFGIIGEEPVAPFELIIPSHIDKLTVGPWPPWVRVTDSEIGFALSGVKLSYQKYTMSYETRGQMARFPVGLPKNRGLALFEVDLRVPTISMSVYDREGKRVRQFRNLFSWPYISPDGERFLVLKHKAPKGEVPAWPIAAWILRADGRTDALIWFEDIRGFAREEDDKYWDLEIKGVVPSSKWDYLVAYVYSSIKKEWRAVILSPAGRFLGKMSLKEGVAEFANGVLSVSEDALRKIKVFTTTLQE